jgi:GNAT superfamily N-acetyltransferase
MIILQVLCSCLNFIFQLTNMEITVRQVTTADTKSINNLSTQLGYPFTEAQTLQNIKAVLSRDDLNAFAAVTQNTVVGWIGLAQIIMIESLPYCEINGLVIDENYRGKGVGRLLIEKAKQWTKEKGNDKLKVRCNIIRTEAHLFYQHLGFTATKRQTNFELTI